MSRTSAGMASVELCSVAPQEGALEVTALAAAAAVSVEAAVVEEAERDAPPAPASGAAPATAEGAVFVFDACARPACSGGPEAELATLVLDVPLSAGNKGGCEPSEPEPLRDLAAGGRGAGLCARLARAVMLPPRQERPAGVLAGDGGDLASVAEGYRTVRVPPRSAGFCRTLLSFVGPGIMVSVGYVDPGNWATNLAGGAQFGYSLLFVVLISNLMAVVLQHLALKLGIATGQDLAQACRAGFSRRTSVVLWLLAEIAIIATDLAEVIGSAIALKLLFGLPLVGGVVVTALDVLLLLMLQSRSCGLRAVEALVAVFMLVIAASFMYNLAVSAPPAIPVLQGFIPSARVFENHEALFVAIGILGATVMPHNLYLHSSLVQSRAYDTDEASRKSAVFFATIESTFFLLFAFFISAAILILSAVAFHESHSSVKSLEEAYKLLSPTLGASVASPLFGVALLLSGQSSTITGTIAGQIVMDGFLDIRLVPWARRLLTRLLAVVPAVIVAAVLGEEGVGAMLVASQATLSVQLSFAVLPLVAFTSSKARMGAFANSWPLAALSWVIGLLIAGINVYAIVALLQDAYAA
jgi:manganese transport protein